MDAPVGALHHVEVWVIDLPASEPGWAWLLGRLGYHRDRTWTGGASYRAGATYIVIEQSPDVLAGEHQRRRAGVNHLAFLEDVAGYEVELVAR